MTQAVRWPGTDYTVNMTGSQAIERLRQHGGVVIRRSKGSHVQVRCGDCQTTVLDHGHEDVGPGLLRKIERDCEPCLGVARR